MAEEYIGSPVRVVLRVPANLRLEGFIANVCNAMLHLEDGKSFALYATIPYNTSAAYA
jgi:hypothetical protein